MQTKGTLIIGAERKTLAGFALSRKRRLKPQIRLTSVAEHNYLPHILWVSTQHNLKLETQIWFGFNAKIAETTSKNPSCLVTSELAPPTKFSFNPTFP